MHLGMCENSGGGVQILEGKKSDSFIQSEINKWYDLFTNWIFEKKNKKK